MKTILHLSCDFPDPMVPNKTKGVVSFIDATPGYRHVVYSLNRANWRNNIVAVPFGEDRTAVAYGAPPRSIQLVSRLRRLFEWLKADLAEKDIQPDVVHAHKLSIEGLLALWLKQEKGLPFVASIWGDTDLKFIHTRRDLRGEWIKAMAQAERLLPTAPWAARRFVEEFGADPAKVEVLLPIIKQEQVLPPQPAANPRFVTLFNLDVYKRKNLPGLLQAMAELHATRPEVTLDIYGRGSPETMCDIANAVAAAGVGDYVNVMGQLPQGAFETTLNSYTAFVMPTLRETFGMVFIEALLCGLPVLHTKGWGIDQLYPDERIGYGWDPKASGDLLKGLLYLLENEEALKRSISAMGQAGEFNQHRRDAIAGKYAGILDEITGRS